MSPNQKTIWIQHLQSKYAKWLVGFNKKLSIGQCSKKLLMDNLIIGNLIDVFYRIDAVNTSCISDEEACTIKDNILTLTEL